jgi:putative hydrolase of the HAD superfamily
MWWECVGGKYLTKTAKFHIIFIDMKNLNAIKVILLDFGGVIASEGFQLGILKFSKLYGKDYDEMYDIISKKAMVGSGYISGKGSEEEFWNIVAKELGIDQNLSECRNLILDNFVPRKEILDTVVKLKDKFLWGVFSDQTNWIYEIDEKYDFLKYFDYKFISYDLGYSKYDDEFYKIPCKKIKLPAENILIVDDKQRVLDRAKEKGYHVFRFDSLPEFLDYIEGIE